MSKHILVVLAVCVLNTVLWACSERKPTTVEHPLPNLELKSKNSAVEQRNVNGLNAWETPELLFSTTISPKPKWPTSSIFKLFLNDTGSTFLEWNSSIPRQREYIKREFGIGTWQKWGIDEPLPSEYLTIHQASKTGVFFAIIEYLNQVSLSIYNPLNGWGPSILVTDMAINYDVYVEQNGNLLISWYESDPVVGHSFSFVRYFSDGSRSSANTISAPASMARSLEFPVIETVSDAQGNTHIFWIEGGNSSGILHWIKHDGAIWSSPQQLTPMNISDYFVGINTTSGNMELILVDDNQYSTMYSKSFTNSVWGSQSVMDVPVSQYTYWDGVTNYNGDINIFWLHENAQYSANQKLNIVNTKRFTPSTNWEASIPISHIFKLPKIHQNYEFAPQLKMNDNGDVFAAWSTPSNIYTNYFDGVNGWHSAEVAVQTQSNSSLTGIIDSALNNNGQSAIVWSEVTPGVDSETQNTFVTSRNVTISPIPTPIPIDTSGIFLSTKWTVPSPAFNIQLPTDKWSKLENPTIAFKDKQTATLINSQTVQYNANNSKDIHAIVHAGVIDLALGFSLIDIPVASNITYAGLDGLSTHSNSNTQFVSWDYRKYVSYQQNGEPWTNPLPLIGHNFYSALKSLSDGRGVYIWQPDDDIDYTLSAILIDPKNINSLSIDRIYPTMSSRLLHNFVEVKDNYVVMPIYDKTTISHELSFIIYIPDIGWQTPTSRTLIPSALDTRKFDFKISNNNFFITATLKGNSHIYANYFDINNQWHDWVDINSDLEFGIRKIGSHQTISNQRGNLFTFWTQEQTDVDGNTVQTINYNQFIENTITMSHWVGSKTVVSTNGLTDKNNFKLHLDELGNIHLAWIEIIDQTTKLVYMQFDVINGWSPSEDIIVYDGINSGELISFDLDGNKSGDVILAWNQLLLRGSPEAIVTWYSIQK